MSFSQQILAGLLAGIGTGLFFGERAALLRPLADGFVGLLQMTVLPYVTVSIVSSLGQLDGPSAKRLALRVGTVLVALWVLVVSVIFLMPLAFPSIENASFFSTTLLERREPFNFITLYVPSNPFNSLANNVVPAVVLFSIVVGIALIGLERREVVLDILKVVGEALARATRFLARLIPIGLFAISAVAAGTLRIEELARLQIYLLLYIAIALYLALWLLPGLVALLTPIPITHLMRETRDVLVTTFVAGNLFIVLPALIEACKRLLRDHGIDNGADAPDAVVPAAFNFPHSGKLMAIGFVLFAGWFNDSPVPASQYPQLGAAGVVTLFGSTNAAVPFLLNIFRLPADSFQLFLATGVLTSRFGALLAAVHTLAIALIGSCALAGALRYRAHLVLRYIAISVVLAAAIVGGARTLFATVLAPEYRKDQVLAGMNLLDADLRTPVLTNEPPMMPADKGSVLAAILARHTLRVGYFTDSLPYVFRNSHGDLVGFDVELAYRLARELGVQVQFVELTRNDMTQALADGGPVDLVMSGVAVTTTRAADSLFSASYLDETLALLVRDPDREDFDAWSDVAAMGSIELGVPNLPYFMEKVHDLLPRARMRTLNKVEDVFKTQLDGLKGVVLTAERGSAWTLLYPQYSIVVPEGARVKIPLAYPLAGRDEHFASFINTWIELKRKDGTLDALFAYWVKGQRAVPRTPRWSILRDVLHWVE